MKRPHSHDLRFAALWLEQHEAAPDDSVTPARIARLLRWLEWQIAQAVEHELAEQFRRLAPDITAKVARETARRAIRRSAPR